MRSDYLDTVEELLQGNLLIDGHNDLPWAIRKLGSLEIPDLLKFQPNFHTDLHRLQLGRVGGQFWSVYVPCSYRGSDAVLATLEQVDLVHRMVAKYSSRLQVATSAADVRDAKAAGKVASLLGAEGGHCIAGSLGVLRMLYQLGVRYLTLTHNENTAWAGSATDDDIGGLLPFGYDVIREMNRLGMLVDVSHTAESTARASIKASHAPVVCTHSACRELVEHPRNVDDVTLRMLADQGGVCMVAFVPQFVSRECAEWEQNLRDRAVLLGLDSRDLFVLRTIEKEVGGTPPVATLEQVADHIEHVREVVGVEHVGIGSDFDGVSYLPAGLDDVSCYPALFVELLQRGWSARDCSKIAGANILRVMDEAEATARHMARHDA